MRHSPLLLIVRAMLLFLLNHIREYFILTFCLNIVFVCFFIGSTLREWQTGPITWVEKVILMVAPFLLLAMAYFLRETLRMPPEEFRIDKDNE